MIENASLLPYNTFHLEAHAEKFADFGSVEELEQLLADHQGSVIRILGGGSNVLLRDDLRGLVLRNGILGIHVVKETEKDVLLEAGAGESWDGFVRFAVNRDLGGLENLSLIPGTVGAAPIQNIGAYGVEAKDTIAWVTGWSVPEKKLKTYANEDCLFGYRDSIFKSVLKNDFIITSVVFRLSKHPVLNTSYGAIREELGSEAPSVRAISEAVIRIRRSKLPDPQEIGNAGSFFKNPEVATAQFEALKAGFPDMPFYPVSENKVKIPAGWLIERLGWKGFRRGDAGVHAKQALVLVNYGKATGKEIWGLSEEILQSVSAQFGIQLEREVQAW